MSYTKTQMYNIQYLSIVLIQLYRMRQSANKQFSNNGRTKCARLPARGVKHTGNVQLLREMETSTHKHTTTNKTAKTANRQQQ